MKSLGFLRSLWLWALLIVTGSVSAQTYVAQIGENQYETLAEAVAAVEANDEIIVMLDDATITSEIVVNKFVTIDLNGKTVTTDKCSAFKIDGDGSNLILIGQEGSKIVGAPENKQLIYLYGTTDPSRIFYSALTIFSKDVTIECTNGYAVMVRDNNACGYGVVVNVRGTVKGDLGGLCVSESITKTGDFIPVLNADQYTKIESANGAAIYGAGYARWVIFGGAVTGAETGIEICAGELVVGGSKSDPTAVITGNGAGITVSQHESKLPIYVDIERAEIKGYTPFRQINGQSNDNITLNISGGTFKAINGGTNAIYSENITGFVSGGKFSSNVPETYCEDGYISVKTDDDMYEVREDTPAAQIGETTYLTLAKAVAAVESNEAIVMLKNVTITSEIVVDKTVTIDLNGTTITTDKCSAFQINGGNLFLLGQEGSQIVGEPENQELIYLYGTTDASALEYSYLFIGNQVTVECTNGYAVMARDNNACGYGIEVNVSGTAKGALGGLCVGESITQTVDDNKRDYLPRFSVGPTGNIVSSNGPAIHGAGYAVWVIYGGTVTGAETGIEISAGYLAVGGFSSYPDPVITGNDAGIIVSQHESKLPINVEIAGGKIQGYTPFNHINDQSNDNIDLKISGGTFKAINGGTNAIYSENITGFVSGGLFSSNVPEAYCEDGYISVKKNDGMYEVKKGTFVAQIGENKYETIWDAINAVDAKGQVVKIISDVELDATIHLTKHFEYTIDLNGHVINYAKDDVIFDVWNNQKVTFLDGVGTGKIKTEGCAIRCWSASNVTLESGTIEGTNGNSVFVKGSGGNYKGKAVFTMNGGTLITSGAHTNAISVEAGYDGAEFIMNGGTMIANNYCINAESNTDDGVKVTVKGGKLQSNNSIVSISDGFAGTISLEGGIYSKEPAAEYIKEGYMVVDNTDPATKETYPYSIVDEYRLVDGVDITHETITVNKVTYTRTSSSEWGTVCLPMAVKADANVTYYTMGMIKKANPDNFTEGDVLTLTEAEGGVLPAGVPAIYHINTQVDGKYVLNIEATAEDGPITLINKPAGDTVDDDINLVGTFVKTQLDGAGSTEKIYYISGGKFWRSTGTVGLNTYRAYFTLGNVPVTASGMFRIAINDDEDLTAIDAINDEGNVTIAAIYDVNGNLYNELQKGINIVKLSNGKTQKIQVK